MPGWKQLEDQLWCPVFYVQKWLWKILQTERIEEEICKCLGSDFKQKYLREDFDNLSENSLAEYEQFSEDGSDLDD